MHIREYLRGGAASWKQQLWPRPATHDGFGVRPRTTSGKPKVFPIVNQPFFELNGPGAAYL